MPDAAELARDRQGRAGWHVFWHGLEMGVSVRDFAGAVARGHGVSASPVWLPRFSDGGVSGGLEGFLRVPRYQSWAETRVSLETVKVFPWSQSVTSQMP